MDRLSMAAWAIFACIITNSAAAATVFTAILEGAQEVSSNASMATGSATLVLNDAQTALSITIDLVGLDLDGTQTPGDSNDSVQEAHIHRVPIGSNVPIVFGFISPNSDTSGDLVIGAGLGGSLPCVSVSHHCL